MDVRDYAGHSTITTTEADIRTATGLRGPSYAPLTLLRKSIMPLAFGGHVLRSYLVASVTVLQPMTSLIFSAGSDSSVSHA
jgi:hypothetical protein